MTRGFSREEAQEELTHHSYPHLPPTLRALLVLFSEDGLKVFGIVDGRGGEEFTMQGQAVLTVYEDAPFAHAFHRVAVGDLVFFADTPYLIAGHDAEMLPDHSVCSAAFGIDQAVRQAVGGMTARHSAVDHTLRAQRVRLDEDSDTVQKAKRYHIYLFEQGRWLAEEGQEHGRLEGRLQALRQARERRDISRLGACYQDELARLTVLEEAVQAGVRRETERQAPLRKRRPTVLLAEEAARLDKKPRNPPRRVQ